MVKPNRHACKPVNTPASRDQVGGRPGDPNANSLGLLPSGPDPVGERFVRHQPPAFHIVNRHRNCKAQPNKLRLRFKRRHRNVLRSSQLLPIPTGTHAGNRHATMPGQEFSDFALDAQLQRDSVHVLHLGLCELRLINDRRWPWLILVPQRPRITESHELQPLDQAVLTFETNLVAAALKDCTECDKINTGALGNVVRQLHVHVIARKQGDPNWPGPVWGFGQPIRYMPERMESLINRLREAF